MTRQTSTLVIAITFLMAGAVIAMIGGGEKPMVPSTQETQETRTVKDPEMIEGGPMTVERQQERRDGMQNWLQAGDDVAVRSGVKEAADTMRFVRANACLVGPNKDGQPQFLEGADGKDHWFALAILLPGDEKYGGPFAGMLAAKPAGYFNPDMRLLTLKQQCALSPVFQGIILIHEGHHAYCYLRELYNWRDQRAYCQAEVRTHSLENAIMAKLGGRSYEEAVRAQMADVLTGLKEGGQDIRTAYAGRSIYNPLLETAFGPAQSEHEKDLRQTHLWIDAVFRLKNEHVPGTQETKEESKALFLLTVYLNSGVLRR